jgi:Holliday junction resolvase
MSMKDYLRHDTSPWLVSARGHLFEEEIGNLISHFGYDSIVTPGSGDHGVDIIATKNGRKVVVQVKLWNSGRVGNGEILKLSGGMNCFGATDALLISTSRLTKKALDAANRCNVQVYEGDTLKELCLQNRLMLPSWSLLISSSGAGSPLITRDLMIGRDPLCDVAVTADRTLSRNHFDLKWDRSRLVLRDLSSSNGTRLNGKRVNDPVVVCYGDVIEAGRQKWRITTADLQSMMMNYHHLQSVRT